MVKILLAAGLLLIILLVYKFFLTSPSVALPPPEISHLHDRLQSLGLPALSTEGTVLHIHQHLDIFVNGSHLSVPAGIGINNAAGFLSPIHTHDTTGVIHVESPNFQVFTLGQFFTVWGITFTNQCLGSYCVNFTHPLKIFVNGSSYTGDFASLPLQAHQEIVVIYGKNPSTIPSSYTFPPNY